MEYKRNVDVQLTELSESLALPAKGLGHPKRLEMLEMLAQGECAVEALARKVGLGVTTTSAHLQTLRRCGLVVRRRQGVHIHYRLAGDDVAALIVLVRRVARAHLAGADLASRAALGLDAPDSTVEPVGRTALLKRLRAGEVVVLDVRPQGEFESAHIPGAISVPLAELVDRLEELPLDREIVAYCRGEFCVLAHEAARVLRASGRRAAALGEGMLEWRAAGRAVARS